jgi:hypothetical protein
LGALRSATHGGRRPIGSQERNGIGRIATATMTNLKGQTPIIFRATDLALASNGGFFWIQRMPFSVPKEIAEAPKAT